MPNSNSPIFSMTGFAHRKIAGVESDYDLSLKSVNGRFLETRIQIPREFLDLEIEIRKMAAEFQSRGSLDILLIRRLRPGKSAHQLKWNEDLVQQYQNALLEIARKTSLPYAGKIEFLARLPEVFHLESKVDSNDREIILKSMRTAFSDLGLSRRQEGAALGQILREHLSGIEDFAIEVGKLKAEISEAIKTKVQQKITSKMAGLEIDPARVTQEIVFLLDKSEITEEVDRLSQHLIQFNEILNQGKAIGKKLDFYCQELLREINTIGSKSIDSRLTRHVVEAKTRVERLREQVQNIE